MGRLPTITSSTGPTAQHGHGAGKDRDMGAAPATTLHQCSPQYLLAALVTAAFLPPQWSRPPLCPPHSACPPPRFPPQPPHNPARASLSPLQPLPSGPWACAPTTPFPTLPTRPLRPLAPLHPTETHVGQECRSHLSVGSTARQSRRRGSAVAACGLRHDPAPHTSSTHTGGEVAQENLQQPPRLDPGLHSQRGLFVSFLSLNLPLFISGVCS